ncbi:MAG TPA: TSUP family transporter [Sediminibacterium sp.]|nr:TSUP family transporter [Sediminibacterium sp.]
MDSGTESAIEAAASIPGNRLFPLFLKLETLQVGVVGGGKIALEKIQAILNNAPDTPIRLIARDIHPAIDSLTKKHANLLCEKGDYYPEWLRGFDILMVAVNDLTLAKRIREDARAARMLINVADTPLLCDFYLGSVVQKGDMKIAISTNGASPTIAKRMKEIFQEAIPDEIDAVLQDMRLIRSRMQGDLPGKVKQLNELTRVLAAKQISLEEGIALQQPKEKKWQWIVKWCLFAFVFMILGATVFHFIPAVSLTDILHEIPAYVDIPSMLIMLLTGFMAQLVDGSLGMGYGTISTTFLLANGVNPAIVSSRVHSARVFSSGVSGYSHHRFGNINRKLFRSLVLPGIAGAVAGACIAFIGQAYAGYVRIPLSLYTGYLGYYIVRKAMRKKQQAEKVKRAGWLAGAGGFLDAFAGGGWGALVTSTLIAKRRNPRYVIGSVCLAEFFVVFSSAITFFILLKHIPVGDVLGLILGGLIAAPLAAKMAGKLPLRWMYFAVGGLVILTSCFTLIKSFHLLGILL